MNKEKILILDFLSLFYAYAFAYKDIYNSKQFPIGGIFGLLNYIFSIKTKYKVDKIICVLEGTNSKNNFRRELLSSYKTNRAPMPEFLTLQLPVVVKLLEALNIRIESHENWEADDSVSSLANIFCDKFEVIIVSRDKDLLQMVSSEKNISVLSKHVLFKTESSVKKKIGVFPCQVADFLALAGDSSDNIPGIYLIGTKTAIKLLEQFSNIEDMIENIEKIINPRQKNKISSNIEQLKFFKQITTVCKELPFEKIDLKNTNFLSSSYLDLSKELELHLV